MGGRPRKPTIIKFLNGEKRKSRLNPNEPKPPLSKSEAPAALDDIARSEFDRLAPMLAEMGLMAELYRNMLAMYCQAWSRWTQAQEMMKKKGVLRKTKSGNVDVSPLMRVSRESFDEMYKAAREFGFSPAAMSKLSVTPKPAKSTWSEIEEKQG